MVAKELNGIMSAAATKKVLGSIDRNRMMKSFGHRRRTGANGVNNLSEYLYYRRDKWSAALKETVKVVAPKDIWDNYLQMHILTIPKGGHLDLQDAWIVDRNSPNFEAIPGIADFIAVSLKPKQEIIIHDENDKPITYSCNAGDGVVFKPEALHEIEKVSVQNDWLVFMVSKHLTKEYFDGGK